MHSEHDNNSFIRLHAIFLVVITALLVAAYYDTLLWMYGRFIGADTYYSHGFLIPFISGYFIWQRRKHLKTLPITSSRWGLALTIAALLLHIGGTIIYIFSISGASLFLLLIGLSLFLYGVAITRAISFPLAFLSFMFPIPMAILNVVAFPLKIFVAKTGVASV